MYIVGCGIKFLSHLTLEVKLLIESCDFVLYLVNDPAIKRWIEENSRNSKSLDSLYFVNSDRKAAYNSISYEVIKYAKKNKTTCFVTYGHPLFLSNSSQSLIKEVGRNCSDIEVDVLPGISSLDSLCCDLRIDPSMGGMQAYEATDFLKENYIINKSSHIILWQIGVVGIKKIILQESDLCGNIEKFNSLKCLKEKLLDIYDDKHPVIIYVASMYQSFPAEICEVELCNLDQVDIPRLATAYIPPEPSFDN
ncbi:SAM-dependent methyltransferase (plasmid) [Legionella sp. D16C41]|uniref:SAM-dependent methyltransferase n=1 Tax=Legionella sp. D16C41 TaxID=3402688 RepID=UPI003AF8E771